MKENFKTAFSETENGSIRR